MSSAERGQDELADSDRQMLEELGWTVAPKAPRPGTRPGDVLLVEMHEKGEVHASDLCGNSIVSDTWWREGDFR